MSMNENNLAVIRQAITNILLALGEDPNREGLKETPHRVARLYADVLDGAHTNPPKATSFTDEVGNGGLCMVHKVPFYGFCEHHLLPFVGTVSIGYIPRDKVLGISKLVRLFRWCAKRVTIQERLTQQAVDLIQDRADAQGVMIHVEAEHLCMSLRGVKSPGGKTTTTACCGVFESDSALRNQFLSEATKA